MEEGLFYHIYNRGNNKQNIFFEKRNYHFFLKNFDKYLSDFVDVYAYCLMPNHFHFLIKLKELPGNEIGFKTPLPPNKLRPVEKAFRDFFISYAKSINKAYGRTGALFQQKFKKKEIATDGYFTSVIQYIHANPIAAGFCNKYENWEFSSYNAFLSNSVTKIKTKEVIDWFGSKEIFIKIHHERKLELGIISKLMLDRD